MVNFKGAMELNYHKLDKAYKKEKPKSLGFTNKILKPVHVYP